jgi:hypothetical protein
VGETEGEKRKERGR